MADHHLLLRAGHGGELAKHAGRLHVRGVILAVIHIAVQSDVQTAVVARFSRLLRRGGRRGRSRRFRRAGGLFAAGAQAQQQYGRKQKGNGSLHRNPSRIEIGAAPLDERRAALFRGFLRGGAEKDVHRRELFPTAGVYIE